AAGEDEAHARRGGRDPDVHGQGQRDPESDGGPVDRGDHGLLHVENPERDGAAAVTVLLCRGSTVIVERRAAGAEIGAGAEGPPRPSAAASMAARASPGRSRSAGMPLSPLRRSRTSAKSNSVGPRRGMLIFAPTSEISVTRTLWKRNGR